MSHKSCVILIFSNHLRQGKLVTLKRSQQVTITVTGAAVKADGALALRQALF